MKRIGLIAGVAVVALIAIVVARTLALGGASEIAAAPPVPDGYDGMAIASHLGQAIQFKTVSHEGDAPDADAFNGLAAFLEQTYPAAHQIMTREVVADHSLVYRWRGSDPSKKPIAFLAHMDVVPVEAGTEDQWTRPPFSGAIHDGALWGRGSLDDKNAVITVMEAVERLAEEGFTPSRDIYLLFGHDEEIGGTHGAAAIAARLQSRGVRLAWTLDEGSGLLKDGIPGVAQPVALISTGEKGYLTLRFSAHAPGGHSSTPPADTAVSLAARAVVAAEDNPFPTRLDQNVVDFLHALAPEMPFSQRLALANLWLTGPLIKAKLAADPMTAAMLHTTTAPTIISGGTKENVLPQLAEATINYRIHPSDNVAGVLARAKRLVDDDRIVIETLEADEPSPRSSTTSAGYRAIAAATTAIFGAVPIAPSLTIAGTDSKHYADVADDNYRFSPFIYTPEDLEGIHGTNEHVRVEALARACAWYEALIREEAGPEED